MLEDNLKKRESIIVGFQVVVQHNTITNDYGILANHKTYHLKKTSKFQNTLKLMQMASELKKHDIQEKLLTIKKLVLNKNIFE